MFIRPYHLRTAAIMFGIILVLIGIGGFIPPAKPNGLLLGVFKVDLLQNLIHIITGIMAFFFIASNIHLTRYFQIIGLWYGVIAIIGIAMHGTILYMNFNTADNILHLLIAVIGLFIGYFTTTGWNFWQRFRINRL